MQHSLSLHKTQTLDRRRSCHSVQVYTDGWRHGMMHRATVTGTGCTVHYLSQVCDGWGPSPDIGVTHYYYGQGAWARQHFTGWCCHGPGLHSGVTLGSQLP